MYKLILTVLIVAILAFGYSILKDADINPGQVNTKSAYAAITQVQDSVKDAAESVADFVGQDDIAEYEGFEGLASKFWTWAQELKDSLD